MISGLAALPALAGDVSFVTLHYSADRFVPQFHYDGPVTEGDARALATLIDQYVECAPKALAVDGDNCAVVTLNSPGGNYIEGLRLAALLRERSIATIVESDARCYSACAFAFLGGSGHSSQSGVGSYIDRIIEPGGILGFHAPYFAPDSLNSLVAEFGLDEVLGASRQDISLMVQQLVDWNVNPNALSHIVNMGPTETYDIIAGGDYTLIWAQLPPAPFHYWNSNTNNAMRNACVNLLAYHLNVRPDIVLNSVSMEPEANLIRDEQGRALSGFRLQGASALAPSFCAVPHEQFEQGGDVDMALYTAPGISGAARPIVSLFNRTDSWSTMGTGGIASRRNMQKGSMSQLFVDVLKPVHSSFVEFMEYLPLRKFARFNQSGSRLEVADFPISSLPVTVLGESRNTRVMTFGQHQLIAQVGSDLLFTTARETLAKRNNVDLTLMQDYENAFVIGSYYPSGRPYLWVGLRDQRGAAAVIRIESQGMPADLDAALSEQGNLACSLSLHGQALTCS